MSEDLTINGGSKKEQYESLIPQIQALLEGEPDLIANLSNIAAALKQQFNWLWTGFTCVDLKEWFDNNDRALVPPLINFLFRRSNPQ